jgi:hypothetical protein
MGSLRTASINDILYDNGDHVVLLEARIGVILSDDTPGTPTTECECRSSEETRRKSGLRYQSVLVGEHDELGSVACTELEKDATDVRLDRRKTHVQLGGDLGI